MFLRIFFCIFSIDVLFGIGDIGFAIVDLKRRRVSREGPQLAVCLDRSLSQYDRNDLAVALQVSDVCGW